ncbi:hypothetical protein HK102_012173 [Quaeritorhiza haematococci]|nr:hypothetical protein HK102_012173 [Quaeritorhiza haematococci]
MKLQFAILAALAAAMAVQAAPQEQQQQQQQQQQEQQQQQQQAQAQAPVVVASEFDWPEDPWPPVDSPCTTACQIKTYTSCVAQCRGREKYSSRCRLCMGECWGKCPWRVS